MITIDDMVDTILKMKKRESIDERNAKLAEEVTAFFYNILYTI